MKRIVISCCCLAIELIACALIESAHSRQPTIQPSVSNSVHDMQTMLKESNSPSVQLDCPGGPSTLKAIQEFQLKEERKKRDAFDKQLGKIIAIVKKSLFPGYR